MSTDITVRPVVAVSPQASALRADPAGSVLPHAGLAAMQDHLAPPDVPVEDACCFSDILTCFKSMLDRLCGWISKIGLALGLISPAVEPAHEPFVAPIPNADDDSAQTQKMGLAESAAPATSLTVVIAYTKIDKALERRITTLAKFVETWCGGDREWDIEVEGSQMVADFNELDRETQYTVRDEVLESQSDMVNSREIKLAESAGKVMDDQHEFRNAAIDEILREGLSTDCKNSLKSRLDSLKLLRPCGTENIEINPERIQAFRDKWHLSLDATVAWNASAQGREMLSEFHQLEPAVQNAIRPIVRTIYGDEITKVQWQLMQTAGVLSDSENVYLNSAIDYHFSRSPLFGSMKEELNAFLLAPRV